MLRMLLTLLARVWMNGGTWGEKQKKKKRQNNFQEVGFETSKNYQSYSFFLLISKKGFAIYIYKEYAIF